MCGGPGMDMKICSTIGYEKQHNPTLAIADEEEFVAQALAKLGPQPPNFEKIVALNRGPLLTSGVEVPALYPRQVQLKREEGALLVDVRTDLQFDDVHIHGLDLHSVVQLRIRVEARLARRARPRRSSSSGATTPTGDARPSWRCPWGSATSRACSRGA